MTPPPWAAGADGALRGLYGPSLMHGRASAIPGTPAGRNKRSGDDTTAPRTAA